MSKIEELHLILELLHKHNLPLSPILEYAINEREEQYVRETNSIATIHKDEPIYDIEKNWDFYIKEFTTLSVGVSKGKKLPHKAILLIGLMNLIESGIITDNRVELDHIIAYAFAYSWNQYFDTKPPTVWIPFYHLKGESFWHFKANGNEEKMKDMLSFGGTPSIGKMRSVIKYAYLDNALFDYLKIEESRNTLKTVLIANYIKS